ncbi:class I SAM-dependent methyltransferase [Abyssibacter profundi]|uniref:Methyltransferase n=1 Tax=Abyssibacter profundi TaxID=2182787 RepID=A0A383XR46_9GAMM|nr:class I SAM-dependent methyltransferase [Abyssibacter profundi]MBV62456.1 methyltransferase [Nevskiales bacterium]PWN55100.1 methyltransferase [Abyssibacter profundi]
MKPRSLLLMVGLLATGLAQAGPATLEAAAAADHRTEAYVARDAARHPVEVLEFFGVDADDTVVELWPSAGYWTEILAPYLADSGQYIAAVYEVGPADTPSYRRRLHGRLLGKLADQSTYGKTIVTTADAGQWTLAPDASVDVVLTFRNVHNLWWDDQAEAFFAAAHAALEPGGVLGVVDHRAKPDADPAELKAKTTGYIRQADVIRMAEAAGFKLAASSEINANPKDDTEHPRGVWTLPPSLALGDTDRDVYQAIGESDRMTLKFVKLLN